MTSSNRECISASASGPPAIEEDGRVTVLWTAVVFGASAESFCRFVDPGSQRDFNEWNSDSGRQLIQGLHELESPDELRDEHIVTSLEMRLGHGAS